MSYWSRLRSWWSPPRNIEVPGDVSRLIASAPDLDVRDIVHLCKTQRQFNNAVCRNDGFWRNLAKERLSEQLQDKSISELKRELIRVEDILSSFSSRLDWSIKNRLRYEDDPHKTPQGHIVYETDLETIVRDFGINGYEKAFKRVLDVIQASQFPHMTSYTVSMIANWFYHINGNNPLEVKEVLRQYIPKDAQYLQTTLDRAFRKY